MKKIFLIVFLIVIGCSKPKTVFICGDHVCVNNAEAEQFFEENLAIEVKINPAEEPEMERPKIKVQFKTHQPD